MAAAPAASARRNFFDAFLDEAATDEAAEAAQRLGGRGSDAAATPADAAAARVGESGEVHALLRFIRSGVVGARELLDCPFGPRRVTYADWTASGRALSFIEDYVAREVLPLYANTHSTASATGLQSTLFRAEARSIVHRCVNGSKDDVVIFAGSGSTGALALLVDALGLHGFASSTAWLLAGAAEGRAPPLVLVGAHEHHSNLLPWLESGAEVVMVPESARGGVDPAALEAELRARAAATRPLVVGAFAAASNVTGIAVDEDAVDEVTALLHRHGALAVWDYAALAPHGRVDMNPRPARALREGGGASAVALYAKDAVVLSPHKLPGGVGAPGVLVAKKRLLAREQAPPTPGGGTVMFVSHEQRVYLQNFEERAEGGTPDIVGAVRCGLAFQLKEAVGDDAIRAREAAMLARVLPQLRAHPSMVVLGRADCDAKRLAIISFLVRTPLGNRFLHHGFVAALLNDLFGIQARSGCACAGPYAHDELGISPEASAAFLEALLHKDEALRPGFTRVSLHYFASEAETRFLADALLFVAEHGWKLLPLYSYFTDSGVWRHRARLSRVPGRRWLGAISYRGGRMAYVPSARELPPPADGEDEEVAETRLLTRYLEEAGRVMRESEEAMRSGRAAVPDKAALQSAESERLRWFALPAEAVAFVRGGGAAAWALPSIAPPPPDARPTRTALQLAQGISRATLGVLSEALRPGGSSSALARALTKEEDDEKGKEQASDEDGEGGASVSASAPPRREATADKGAEEEKRPVAASAAPAAAAGRPVCDNCFHHHNGSGASARGGAEVAGECVSCSCVAYKPMATPTAASRARVTKKLTAQLGRAIKEFAMIRDGDAVLVGLSGGKDSLSLLHALVGLQRRAPVRFRLAAATVDPQTPEYNPRPLRAYVESLGVPYFYLEQSIMADAQGLQADGNKLSICSYCARMKRGMLYSCCRRQGFNVLALGQHLDDLVESFLMSLFHNGKMRTQKACYLNEDGDIRIIRPLCYVRERVTREYAAEYALPVINENCPACFEAPKERARMKALLASQEALYPSLFSSLAQAMHPLIAEARSAPAGQRQRERAEAAAERGERLRAKIKKVLGDVAPPSEPAAAPKAAAAAPAEEPVVGLCGFLEEEDV
jgi:selenocysteine lyase/cysteine desulfurase/tRNA(Ile)-lysidine synthase TilS/MesJ